MGNVESKNAQELIRSGLKKRTTIIRNPLAFRLEYDPKDLFVRNEIELLIKDILDYVKENVPAIMIKEGKKSYLKRFFYTQAGFYKDILYYDTQKILYDLTHEVTRGLTYG